MLLVGLCVLVLAYANGANDNFKGVATLFGSRTLTYRQAISLATITTLAGSLAAVALAGGLVRAFSGAGLVPEALTGDPAFLVAVATGAAVTVLVATVSGIPISTTHALTGALAGAGLAAAGAIHWGVLGQKFVLPLAVSPLLSMMVTGALYPLFRGVRRLLGIERQMCLCVEGGAPQAVQVRADGTAVLMQSGLSLTVDKLSACRERYQGRVFGFDAQRVLDRLHLLSAGAVSFARGLQDTPKIVALLIAAQALQIPLPTALAMTGIAMACGGLLNARRVAVTMSERIAPMNHGQGLTANLTTSLLVLFASRWGMPVSTTHVACGSLFGLGAVTGGARWTMISAIALAWVVTLPLAAVAAAACYRFL